MHSPRKTEDGIESDHSSDSTAPVEEPGFPELTDCLRKMMFVSGETSEASAETTSMIEEIVHTQVVEMVSPQSADNKKLKVNLNAYSSNDQPRLQPDVDLDPSQQWIFSS